jgi:hypothetical protein
VRAIGCEESVMTDTTTSFERDILPLFRPVDIEHMAAHGVQLDDYAYMSEPENAERVYQSIQAKRMPPPEDGATWPQDQVRRLREWIDAGRRP